jgi:very-short-patch-repair endonuclease
VSRRTLERALDEAEAELRLDWRSVADVLDRHPARAGAARVRAVLADHHVGSTRSRSPLEEAVLALCDRHDLPRPRLNAMVAGMEVDCWWPEHRLVVEADSRRHHLTTRAFERDRIRDAELLLEGIRVLRLTHRRLTEDERGVVEALRRLLADGVVPSGRRGA